MEYYDWLQHFDQLEPCQSFPTSAELAVSLGASPISLASIPTQNAELAPSWTGCCVPDTELPTEELLLPLLAVVRGARW